MILDSPTRRSKERNIKNQNANSKITEQNVKIKNTENTERGLATDCTDFIDKERGKGAKGQRHIGTKQTTKDITQIFRKRNEYRKKISHR